MKHVAQSEALVLFHCISSERGVMVCQSTAKQVLRVYGMSNGTERGKACLLRYTYSIILLHLNRNFLSCSSCCFTLDLYELLK